jgi:CheY-like chemotaxis protein
VRQTEQQGGSAAIEILLVEDNPCDVILFRHILRKSSHAYSLTVVMDGAQAIQRLKNSRAGNDAERPDVIFLDLNLPGESGAEVLAEMKADPVLSAIPVAVLTGSDHVRDRDTCTLLGVDAYFNKSAVLQDFFKLSSDIDSFLTSLQMLPAPINSRPDFPATSAA